jgi:ABC-type transport system involved in multi-copper enzyme maturation permease subunit
VRRWEILMGKWLGFAGMITMYLILMAGGIAAIIYLRSDHVARNFWEAMGLLELNALLILSVSIFGGTFLSTLANGVLVFGLYGVAFIGGWIEQIGSLLRSEAAVNIGIVSSLLMPSEALWKRAAFEMQSPLTRDLGSMTPFSSTSVPNEAMILYAVAYIAVALALALRQFSRRDL